MTATYAKVWPKTFIFRAESETSPVHVFGGKEEDVWVASFADRSEAEAWRFACTQFGEEVIGVKDSAYGTLGEQSGELPAATDEGSGGSGSEVQGDGEGGAGSVSELPESLPLLSGDEVGSKH